MTNEAEIISPCEQSWQTMTRDALVEERDSMRETLEGLYKVSNILSKKGMTPGRCNRKSLSGLV